MGQGVEALDNFRTELRGEFLTHTGTHDCQALEVWSFPGKLKPDDETISPFEDHPVPGGCHGLSGILGSLSWAQKKNGASRTVALLAVKVEGHLGSSMFLEGLYSPPGTRTSKSLNHTHFPIGCSDFLHCVRYC